LQRNYGMSITQYDALWAAQQGQCAACGQVETATDPRTQEVRWLCVDHDHVTGKVRGLLCTSCNTALGHLQDDPARIRGLLAYIETTGLVEKAA